MFVWRLPLPAAAGLAVAVALIIVIPVAIYCRNRARSATARGIWSTIMVAELIASPGVYAMLMEPALAEQAGRGIYIDRSPLVAWVPAFFGVGVLLTAHLLFPPRGNHEQMLRWRSAFVVSVIAFAILNLMNWCRAGLCAHYGFPFAFLTWGGAMTATSVSRPGALVANLLILAGFASVLSLRYRRPRD